MRSYLTLNTAFAAIFGLLGTIATQARPLSKGSTTSSGSYEVPVIAIYDSEHDQYLSPKHPAAVLSSDMDIVPITGNLERRITPLIPSSPTPNTPGGQLDFGVSPCHVVSPPPPPPPPGPPPFPNTPRGQLDFGISPCHVVYPLPPPPKLLLELPLLHETTSMVSKSKLFGINLSL